MHGIIGQLAADPVRLAIAVVTLIACLAIVRCLSGLAFFFTASQHEHAARHRNADRQKSDSDSSAASSPPEV